MIRDRLLDYYYDLRDFVGAHKKIVMPVFLLVCVLITVGAAFGARRQTREAREAAEASMNASSEALTASEVPLEKNAYPEVNDLMKNYYQAVADGDADTIASLSSTLSEEERIRVQEMANYVDSYTQIDVYTKTGPVEGSYIAYVYTKLKLKDHDWEIPGLQTMYVCTRDDGSLYINNEEKQSEDVANYIQTASVADDVVDLNNQTAAEYNELLDNDPDLKEYLDQIASTIDISVGQQLAALEESRTSESADATYLVANTDGVNIRKSASADGTKIGTANTGDRFQLVEELEDGWSEIIFNGQQAYVKSEFFDKEEPSAEAASGETTDGAAVSDDAAESGTEDASGGVSSVSG